MPLAERRDAARAGSGEARAAGPPLAGHARPRPRRGLVPALRGRRPRRRHGQAPRRALPTRRAHDDQGQARAHRRLRRRRLPLAQERRAARWSARSCSASTTTPARSTTSASPRRSRTPCASSSSTSSRRCARTRSKATPGATGPRRKPKRHAKAQRLPGASSRWNRGKDLSWEPLRPERVVEVAYDHMQGDRFRHAAQFVRWRPDKPPAGLPLRPARGHAGLRAGARLRRAWRPRAGAVGGAVLVAGRGERVVVGIGRLLGGLYGINTARWDESLFPGGLRTRC